MNMACYIYALYTSDNDEIRYVGQTKNSLKQRLCEHLSNSLSGNERYNTHKNKWIRSVYKRGERVLIKPIEEVNEANINEREIYWINFYKSRAKLTNQLAGGNSGGIGGKIQNFLPYEQAKQLICELSCDYNIKSMSSYWGFLEQHEEYRKFLPKYANDVYKLRGTWISWRDYLSSKFMNPKDSVNTLIDLDTLKQIIRNNKIKNLNEYEMYRKRTNMYNGKRLPAHPDRAYKKQGWNGFGDFWYKNPEEIEKIKQRKLRKGSSSHKMGYFTIYGLKKYLWQYNFKTPTECVAYLSEHKHPRVPENIPEHYISTGEWRGKGWGYLLKRGDCCSEEVFRRYLRLYKIDEQIHSVNDWYVFCRQHNVSKKVPRRICLRYGKPESDFFMNIKAHPKRGK